MLEERKESEVNFRREENFIIYLNHLEFITEC